MTTTSARAFQPSLPGTVIFNYGDPAFRRASSRGDDERLARDIFLRLLAYSPFAEEIAIPSRYVLDGAAMHQAVMWAAPLLEVGVVKPNRRADVASFAELAEIRRLGPAGTARAHDLDRLAKSVRPIHWASLETAWRHRILLDLEPDGPLRRILSRRGMGALRGRNAANLNAVAEHFAQTPGGVETFTGLVATYCDPSVWKLARQWAMVRYYQAPMVFDHVGIREMSREAGALLLEGRSSVTGRRAVETPPPVSYAMDRFAVNVPLAADLDVKAPLYCSAVLRVRERHPAARATFTERTHPDVLERSGQTINEALVEEMQRQLRGPSSLRRWTARVGVTLVGTGAGVAMGGVGPVLGPAVGIAAEWGIEAAVDRLRARRHSWALALDELAIEPSGKPG